MEAHFQGDIAAVERGLVSNAKPKGVSNLLLNPQCRRRLQQGDRANTPFCDFID